MFEDIWRFSPREYKKTHIMAVDVSTSAITAIIAVKHIDSHFIEIFKILNSPFDLLVDNVSEGRIPRVLRDSFLKIFKDAQVVSRHLDDITVILSDPFFSDMTFSKKIERSNPKMKISEKETSALLESLKKDSSNKDTSLALVGNETLLSMVNGYKVLSPVGYKGKTVDMSVVFTFVNKFVNEAVIDAHDKFFPRARLSYISDSRLLRNVIQRIHQLDEPSVVFDIDGESTGIYLIAGDKIEHLGITAFGLKTLERKSPLIKRHADGMLEEKLSEKALSDLEHVISSWWEEILLDLKRLDNMGYPKTYFIAGREPLVKIFFPYLENALASLLGFKPVLQIFSIEPMKNYIYPVSILNQYKDMLLASFFN